MVVAEVGHTADEDQLYRLTFDGSVADERGYVAMGGSAENITAELKEKWHEGMGLPESLQLARSALSGEREPIEPDDLEVAVLERNRERRCFRRLTGDKLGRLLADGG